MKVTTRIAICGTPKSGKTTFAWQAAEALGVEPWSTDDLETPEHDWVAEARQAAEWLRRPGPWIAEGVTVSLALERLLSAPPCSEPDVVIWLDHPHLWLSDGQETLADGCRRVWGRVYPQLGSTVLLGLEDARQWLIGFNGPR